MKPATTSLSSTLFSSSSQYCAELVTLSSSTGLIWNFTTADANVTSGSTTWTTGTLSDVYEMRVNIGLDVDGATVAIKHGNSYLSGTSVSVPQYVMSGNLDNAFVSIYKSFSSASVTDTTPGPILMFSGHADEILPNSFETTIKFVSTINKLKLDFPHRTIHERCPFVFGDSSCGYNVLSATGSVVSSSVYSTLSSSAMELWSPLGQTDFYSGTIEFITGQNAGLKRTMYPPAVPPAPPASPRLYKLLFTPNLPVAPADGDQVRVIQSCDKTRTTCRDRWDNIERFGGFPDAPFKGNQYNAIIGTKRVRHWSRGFLNIGGHAYYSNEPVYGAPPGSPRLVGEQWGSVMPVVYGTARCPTTIVFNQSCSYTASEELDPTNNPGVYTDVQKTSLATVFAVCEAPVTGFNGYYVNDESTSTALTSIFSPSFTLSGAATPVPGVYEVISGTSSPWIYYNYIDNSGSGLSGTAHSGTAHIRGIGLLNPSTLPNIVVDVRGKCIASSSTNILDIKSDYDVGVQWDMPATGAFPPYVIKDILSNSRYGFNMNPEDVVVTESLGGYASCSYDTYCSARHSLVGNDLFSLTVSRVVDSQTAGDKLLQDLLDATNSTAVYTRGKIYIVPDGKSTLQQVSYTKTIYLSPPSGDPVTYTKTFPKYDPPAYTGVTIGDDDLIKMSNSDVVELLRTPDVDVYNSFQVKFKNFFADNKDSVVEYTDQIDANVRGIRMKQVTNEWINNPNQAYWLAVKLVDKSLNNRNTYKFTVGPKFSLLEPTDIIYLNSAALGIDTVKIRITTIEQGDKETLKITGVNWQ